MWKSENLERIYSIQVLYYVNRRCLQGKYEYTLLKDDSSIQVFLDFVKLINFEAPKGMFYNREMIYCKYDDMEYWTIDNYIEKWNST